MQSICKQTSMPVLKNDVIKSLTFLRLSERHQATLDELYVLMQRFPRVILFSNCKKGSQIVNFEEKNPQFHLTIVRE